MDYSKSVLSYLLKERADQYPDKIFSYFTDVDEEISYEILEAKTNQVGNALLNMGLGKASHVGMLAQNSPEFLYSWFATGKIGALFVPLNTKLKGELLSYQINDSDIETLIVEEAFLELVLEIKNSIPKLKRIILISSDLTNEALEEWSIDKYLFTDLLHYNNNSDPNIKVNFDDPVSILYTSGTTGPSKGVVLSHHYYYHVGNQFRIVRNLDENQINLTALPWFHGAAQLCHTYPSFVGKGSVVMTRNFNPETFWHDVKKYKATQFHHLSSMIYSLWNYPKRAIDADHNPIAAFGGPIPWKIVDEFAKRFNVDRFIEGFGQTEALYLGTDYGKTKIKDLVRGSCGKAMEGFDVKIVNEQDIEVPNGQSGEIVVRPEHPSTIFTEYYKKPEATLKSIKNLWFHTGDRGYKDDADNFYFVDRIKETIRKSGENISSYELEKIILKYDGINECAAVPVPGTSDDDVMIVVTLQEGVTLDHKAFLIWCKQEMPYYMIPRYIRIVSSLPKTASHKVEKYKLKKEGITEDAYDRKAAGINIKEL